MAQARRVERAERHETPGWAERDVCAARAAVAGEPRARSTRGRPGARGARRSPTLPRHREHTSLSTPHGAESTHAAARDDAEQHEDIAQLPAQPEQLPGSTQDRARLLTLPQKPSVSLIEAAWSFSYVALSTHGLGWPLPVMRDGMS